MLLLMIISYRTIYVLNISEMAGNKCVYYNCGLSKRSDPSIKMYQFPVRDAARCKTWIINSGELSIFLNLFFSGEDGRVYRVSVNKCEGIWELIPSYNFFFEIIHSFKIQPWYILLFFLKHINVYMYTIWYILL